MGIKRLVVSAMAVALLASTGSKYAVARDLEIFGLRDKTRAYGPFGGVAETSYGGTLYNEILCEIRANYVPFRLAAPATILVLFAVNRRGELVHVSVAQKARVKIIDDYVRAMIRQASRRFPPPPADLPGEPLAFRIPIILQ